MRVRLREERGVALVVALLVTFVVLLLSTTVFAMAIRNSEQSGYDRKRLQSVSAAEAGLNAAYQHITAPPSGLAGLTNVLQDSVGSGPSGSNYDVAITYYPNADGTGTPMTPPFTISYYPKSALITSAGASNGKAERTMETFVILTPVFAGFEGAIVANSTTTFTNQFTINGFQGDDGHIYVLNGDFNAPSGLETIKGNVYVPTGSASIGTSVHLYGSVWANVNVTLNHPQVIVDGDLKASTGSVTVTQGAAGGRGDSRTPAPSRGPRTPPGGRLSPARGPRRPASPSRRSSTTRRHGRPTTRPTRTSRRSPTAPGRGTTSRTPACTRARASAAGTSGGPWS